MQWKSFVWQLTYWIQGNGLSMCLPSCRLKKILENIIQIGVDNSNVIELFEIATYHGAESLRDFCYNYLRKNFKMIQMENSFKKLDFEMAKNLFKELDPGNYDLFIKQKKIEEFNKIHPSTIKPPIKSIDLNEICKVCGKKSTLRCSRCQLVYYCCGQHQKEHWKVHKKECKKV